MSLADFTYWKDIGKLLKWIKYLTLKYYFSYT